MRLGCCEKISYGGLYHSKLTPFASKIVITEGNAVNGILFGEPEIEESAVIIIRVIERVKP